ncbi:LysM peptidoglycan-binding domain-containing protein [Labedella endophytica]|uniref:LysM domain-containing protein n=1 Tax=Labedella endophytica TaxID=1523160 RepID=A0A3S0X7D4_9MICO|nr:LysM peptidoglycan-binding domain-containing protein [Labedella endophytica]RUR01064.1 hypothetical protein ELQ94_05925 [Labedella endophytica]
MTAITTTGGFTNRASANRASANRTSNTGSHLRITRRGRLVLTSLLVGPLVVAGVVAGVSATSAIATSSSSAVVEFDYLTISAGESLWQVAERIAPASDPRDVVADIVSLNQMSTSSVDAGQRIAIPVAYTG